MEPVVLLRITPQGLVSVQIHSETEREEKVGLKLYARIKPALRLAEALLLHSDEKEPNSEARG